MSRVLYEIPKLVLVIGQISDNYKTMSEEEKSKIVWEGAKALIAGAAKYDIKKTIPPIYSLIMENSSWSSTVDWVADVLKKYGQDKTTKEVLVKAVADFVKEGGRNQPTS